MKVKYTLEKTESQSIHQMFEDIPTDLCRYVDCPDVDGDACENCPIKAINHKWENIHDRIQHEIIPMLKKIEQ